MDIEGAELAALNGARHIIAGDSPLLAISAYHLLEHLWEIPLAISRFNPNYRYYLRQHGGLCETVCYAIPK
jgi:hypothetical protein